ncbi:MAG: DUF3054 domain-containing protein [Chloroflexaceae bacterium]|nr:DUF3054 domain-containing protein [Chloroflexaceae bacterium]
MTNTAPTALPATPSATRLTYALLIGGDLLAFTLFAIIGRRSHSEAAGLMAWFEVLKTAAPFMLGWFLVAPWLGAFRARDYQAGADPSVAGVAQRTALAWLVAAPLALLLRAILLQRGIPFSFALITFITNLTFLVAWRSLFAWLWRKRGA